MEQLKKEGKILRWGVSNLDTDDMKELTSAPYAEPNSNVAYFSIKQTPVWGICASYKKGAYLSKAEEELIEIASDYLANKLKQ